MTATIRILGLDPGLRNTGWGIIDVRGNRLSFVAAGTIKPPVKHALAARLECLHVELLKIIEAHRPDEAGVEETFVSAGPQSALKLGQARGIVLMTPQLAGLVVGEYAANLVKKSVVGSGHAGKGQIDMMVKVLLPGAKVDSEDAADALAIAICHAHHRTVISVANRVAK